MHFANWKMTKLNTKENRIRSLRVYLYSLSMIATVRMIEDSNNYNLFLDMIEDVSCH